MASRYYPTIDLLKCLAIISVILLHTIPYDYLNRSLYQLHIYQAVPLFMVLTGVTLMITFGRPGHSGRLRDYFNLNYLGRKAKRIIYPLLPVFFISLLFGLWNNHYYAGVLWIAGCLPVSGPGNYYVTILLQLIIIAPFLSYFYRKSPRLVLTVMVIADLGFQLMAPHLGLLMNNSYAYAACILRYFSALAFGMLVSDEFLNKGYVNLKDRKYRPLLLVFPLSVLYLAAGAFLQQPFPLFDPAWRTQNILSFAYTAVLAVFILNLGVGRFVDGISGKSMLLIGKASYHIFLVQILFFGFGLSFTRLASGGDLAAGGTAVLLNLIATIAAGLLFYRLEPAVFAILERGTKRTINVFSERIRATH